MEFHHSQPAFDSVHMRSAPAVGPSMPAPHPMNQLTPIASMNHQYSSQPQWANNSTAPASANGHHFPASMYQGPTPGPSTSTATINNLLNDNVPSSSHNTHHQHSQQSLPHPHQLPQVQTQASHAQAYSDMMGFGRPPSMSPTTFTDSAYSSSASPSSPTYTLASPASPLGLPHHFSMGSSSASSSARGSLSAPRQTPGSRSFSHDSNIMHPSALAAAAAAAQHQQQQHQQTSSNVHSSNGLYQFDNAASAFTPRTQGGYHATNSGPSPSLLMNTNGVSTAANVGSVSGMLQPHSAQLRQQPQQQPTSPVEPNHQDSLRKLMGQFSSKKRAGPQRKHQCRICQHAFTRPSSVDIHIRSHTGEKPFGCSVEGCDRYFSVLSNARRHERTHLKKEAAKAGLAHFDTM
ncbi:uncharacterized protein BROUX77_006859 [Berkeleyomyces rouxiae]|uniref:uncharacterized protein n=1 Tax=Berkeleyomyces rouxiae TaxID=2035830 RepID=UPI003B7DBF78